MSEVKDRTEVDFVELINANQMTDELWAEVEAYAHDAMDKDWSDYLERKEHFDDAYFTQSPYFFNLWKLASNKGYVYEEVLTKDGEVVPSQVVKTKYGQAWIVKASWDYNAEIVEWVNVSVASSSAKKQAHYAKKGYQLVLAEVRGSFKNSEAKPIWSDVKSVEVI